MAAPKRVVCIGKAPQEMIEQVKLIVEREDIEFTAATGRLEGIEAVRRVKPNDLHEMLHLAGRSARKLL